MSLEAVAKLVAEHSPSGIEVQKKVDRAQLERALVRTMFNGLMWGMFILAIGIFLVVLNKYLAIGPVLGMASSLFILMGVVVASVGVLRAIKQGTMLPSEREAKQISGSPDTNSLSTPPIPAALPSVTERTTQLIAVEEAPTNKMMDTKANE